MRKFFVLALVIAMSLIGSSIAIAADGTQSDSVSNFTGTAGTGINNTVHDLSTAHNAINYVANPADPLTRICIFCHAPHNTIRLNAANSQSGLSDNGSGPQATAAFDYLPLWNHELTANTSFTMYENGTGAPITGSKASQAMAQGMTSPGGVSLLCLSCHDGTIGVNSYGNTDQPSYSRSGVAGGLGTGDKMGPGYIIGKDAYLGNHHPIGFDYDLVVTQDNAIRSADNALYHSGDPVRNHLYSSTVGGTASFMECATCHAVHNTGNTGESLLYRSDTSSKLCLTCHIKGTDPTTAGSFDTPPSGMLPY